METESEPKRKNNEFSEDEKRANVIRLAFKGDEQRFQEFCTVVREAVPEAHAAVVRGSAVSGYRWNDGAPFDADGPGTSDIDLNLVGGEVLRYYTLEGCYIPGLHSMPLCEEHPDIAPDLLPLRERLMKIVGRPVNIQASSDWVQYVRGDVLGQPYFTLFGAVG